MTGNDDQAASRRDFSLEEAENSKILMVMELRRYVADTRVISALERIPREKFIPRPFALHAYRNTALPIGCGQTISQPVIVAQMTEALELGDRMRVLEIGAGSGYQAAVLSQLCRRVYTIERHKTLLQEARQRFQELGLSNITAIHGDGAKGWPEQAPFDRILATAAPSETSGVPAVLLSQLKEDGIMVLPVGPAIGEQMLVKLSRKDGRLIWDRLMPVRFVPLVEGDEAGG
ncbi:protein-L-isoaspartate O-methyltransferase [Alphaproteobacteria bacterium]|nr:protein-L-isoaspartate O-methyltransferase [Alphaproteobacteria bacterium]